MGIPTAAVMMQLMLPQYPWFASAGHAPKRKNQPHYCPLGDGQNLQDLRNSPAVAKTGRDSSDTCTQPPTGKAHLEPGSVITGPHSLPTGPIPWDKSRTRGTTSL